MSRPLKREDWNDISKLQTKDGRPLEWINCFALLDDCEYVHVVIGRSEVWYRIDGTCANEEDRIEGSQMILKPEIEAADSMADAEMAEQKSDELDWSDVTKLQSREGIDVVIVHVVPEWTGLSCPVFIELVDGRSYCVNRNGMYRLDCEPSGLDIIPKPQLKPEPRSVERWVSPSAFYADGIEYKMRHQSQRGYVRVRITEVVE